MNDLTGRLAGVYAWLLRLYPRNYQSEFAEERQEVFAQALSETAAKGEQALLRLMVRELRDLPGSVFKARLREWEGRMKRLDTNLGEERLSWIGMFLAVWPYIFFGPLMAVAPYLPQSLAQFFRVDSTAWLVSVVLFSIIAVGVGWRKRFPRWVYPYLVILFFAIAIPLMAQLSLLLGGDPRYKVISAIVLVTALPGLVAVVAFVMSRIPATRKVLQDIRSDWTRLSFGMVVYVSFVTGFYGGDHLPAFGPAVWLPSLVVVVGVIAYLMCRSRGQRSLALLATLFLSILGIFIFSTDDVFTLLPVALVVLLIFLPAVLALFPDRARPVSGA